VRTFFVVLLIGLVLIRCGGGGSSTGSLPDSSVHAAWFVHPDLGVTGYVVYAGPSLAETQEVARTGATEVVIPAPPTIVSGDTYCVRVAAINADGESPKSEGICLVW
jgi:hypothetical protein